MYVAKKITIDLNRPRKEVVHLGQGDSFTRWIELNLLCDGVPYDPTADLPALGIQDGSDADIIKTVKYIKANGIPGEYENIPEDGTTPAVALMDGETNVYIVRLDEHATDVPGFAEIFVTFYVEDIDSNVHVLHTFPITIDVVQNTTNATDPGSPYYNIHSFLVAGAQAEKTADMNLPVGIDANGKLWAESLMTAEAKDALLALLAKCAYVSNDAQTDYDRLANALSRKLSYIVADYEQDRPIYDTDSLDAIKVGDDLIVTAYYDDGTHIVLADSAYTLSGTLTVGTSTITVSYGGKTDTISVSVTHQIVGWYYPFNESIVSAGSHDFGLQGTALYANGVNAGDKCYHHKVGTEGDSTTDPLGLYALASTDAPAWGNSDFTIAQWFKDDSSLRGWLFVDAKCVATSGGDLTELSVTIGNVASGWSVAMNTVSKKYCGLRIGTVSQKLYVSIVNADVTKGRQINLTPPNTFDTTQWHHYALTRSGAVLYYFVDGNLIYTATISESDQIYVADSIIIGNSNKEDTTTPTVQPYPFSSYHQDLYVNVGTAKWTSNFDPSAIVY